MQSILSILSFISVFQRNATGMNDLKVKSEYIILIFMGLLVYMIGMSNDVFIDTSKYAALSRYVAETGKLVHLNVMGEPYLQKPPFMFWLSALSFKLFGISNFTFKLPSFLLFLLGVFATYRLGMLLYGLQTGIVAAVMLTFCQGMFLFNNDTHTDMVLSMLIIFSIWQLAEYLKTGNKINYLLGFTGAGLGFITKGPVGLLVPAFAIGGNLILTKGFKSLIHYKWIPGILVVVLIATPVLKGLYDQFGWEGLKFFFWTNNAGRISGSYAGHSKDFLFYFHTLLLLFLPWSLFTYIAIFQELKVLAKNNFRIGKAREFICWSGILIFVGILSLARMKSPHYMLPVLPLFALITAKWIIRYASGTSSKSIFRFSVRLQWVISAIFLILALIIPSIFFPHQSLGFWITLSLMILFFFYIQFFYKEQGAAAFLINSVIAVIVLNFSINAVVFPEFNKYNAAARASECFNQLASENAILYTFLYPSHETGFYAKNKSLIITCNNREEVFSREGNWIFTTAKGMDSICNSGIPHTIIDTFPYLKLARIKGYYFVPDLREKGADKTFLLKIN